MNLMKTAVATGLAFVLAVSGCTRFAGQVESFPISGQGVVASKIPFATSRDVTPKFGDPIRYTSDVMTLVVEDVSIHHLPPTLTASRDVIVFAEVWEDAATASSFKPLVGVVYTGQNVLVPGRLNFNQAIAYGPTHFKGRPLKVKFTVLVLVKDRTKKAVAGVNLASGLVSAAAPASAGAVSSAAAILRDVLRAQPDTVAFDFETTLMSDRPEGSLGALNERIPVAEAVSAVKNDQPLTTSQRGALLRRVRGLQAASAATQPMAPAPYGALARALQVAPTNGVATTLPADAKEIVVDAAPAILNFGNLDGTLGYGRYALVETLPQQMFRDGSPDHLKFEGKALPGTLQHERGFLWDGTRKLGLNYLVFRIDPSQPGEDDDVLQKASADTAALLEKLRVSDTDTEKALGELSTDADALGASLLRSRLDRDAAKIAKTATTADAFESAFKTKESKWEASEKYKDVYESVRDAWKARYADAATDDTSTTKPTTQP